MVIHSASFSHLRISFFYEDEKHTFFFHVSVFVCLHRSLPLDVRLYAFGARRTIFPPNPLAPIACCAPLRAKTLARAGSFRHKGKEKTPHRVLAVEQYEIEYTYRQEKDEKFQQFLVLFSWQALTQLKTPNFVFVKLSSFIDKSSKIWYNVHATQIAYF